MEVTKNNFAELLPTIKKLIDDCDFVAIDTELTGLYSSRTDEHAFDTMEERYMKIREQCSNFLINQFGLSVFKYDADNNKYLHKDFNFYVFPDTHLKSSPDPTFFCQTSSLHFLASHGFDFNKVIYKGIPYLTHAHEEEVRKNLVKRNALEISLNVKQTVSTNGPNSIDIPKEHEEFISKIQSQVDSFMSDEKQKEIKLETCNAYFRKLIYQVIQSKYQKGIDMNTKFAENNQKYISITKCSENEKIVRIKAKEESDLADLDATVGFRKLMDHLSASKKLIIGHCMYLDIFHMIEQFFFPLPQDLQEFKSMVRMSFPHIMDTKSLVNSEKLKPFFESTSLSGVASQLQGKAFGLPQIETEEGFGYKLESEQYHEAGYDAFLTGVCFIGLARKLGAVVQKTERINLSSKHLTSYANRFHILRHFDIPYLNLAGPDPEPNRDNVFYVSFPSEWKTVDLVEMFLAYGNVYVSWLDDTSALVALKNPDLTLVAKKNLLNKPSRLYQVMPFSDYQKWTMQRYEALKGGSLRSSNLSAEFKLAGSKRRNSGSIDGSASCSMELIPEDDENEAETSDTTALPPAKKLKPIEEESEEISSTAIIFDEENAW